METLFMPQVTSQASSQHIPGYNTSLSTPIQILITYHVTLTREYFGYIRATTNKRMDTIIFLRF